MIQLNPSHTISKLIVKAILSVIDMMIKFVEDAHCFQAVSVVMSRDLTTSDRDNNYCRKEAQ